jgi:alpha-L-arabinofuranosidase
MTMHKPGFSLVLSLFVLSTAPCQVGEKSQLVTNMELGKQQTVITYGTSLTAGGAWVRQLQQALERKYPGKAKLINSAKGAMWSTWGVDNLDAHLIQKRPDTVLIEFAINDAYLPYKTSVEQARSNLDNMIDRILNSNAACEIVLMVMNPPVGVHLERRPKIKDYYQMYRGVAQDRKLLLIDHYPVWESILNENATLFRKYVPDGIHPGPEGCKAVITPTVLQALGVEAQQDRVSVAASLPGQAYHVSPNGLDGNPGSESRPFKTISAAAAIAQAGDVVTVHKGVYRERVNPPRGGRSEDERIEYQAAPGERVVIKGSEIIKGWSKVQKGVWKVQVPNSLFGDFNPYKDVIGGEWYGTPRDGYNRHTGAVYLNGDWLDEAPGLEQVLGSLEAASKDKVLGGQTASYAGSAVAATDEDILYQSCRYNLKGYRLAVPNGTYRVTLKFCEPHFDARDKRVFDVKLQGKTLLRAVDIFAKVGKFAAHDERFDSIEVSDGQLKIDVINRVSMACISGIVIEKAGFLKKINCGGPAWQGYLRDPAPELSVAHDRPLWYAKVGQENTSIWAQFRNCNPNQELVEINVRQSIFYPDQAGRNYITVRGFTLCQAATPWSGAMSEQIGLIGTHWSKGWIIENNRISHSMNTGITLGRYDLGKFSIAMPPATAPGFVQSVELALEHGWSKEKIGSHVVRQNHISHCEKNGIHGSLGGIFSVIEGNTICDIAQRGWISGPDVAGLKLLGSHDTLVRGNHIYRCKAVGGIWLDWMAQGTRVTGNLLHDNSQDLFMEVNHGPFLIDHNLFLSLRALRDWSQGGAYVHNLFAGHMVLRPELRRETPFHKIHSTEMAGLSNIPGGDDRFYNNVFAGHEGLSPYDKAAQTMHCAGNVYLAGAKPSTYDRAALTIVDLYSGITLQEKPDGWWLDMAVNRAWMFNQKRAVISTELLGRAKVPDAPYEQPDGSPYRLDADYFGRKRNTENPAPGPFQLSSGQVGYFKVWPKRELNPKP